MAVYQHLVPIILLVTDKLALLESAEEGKKFQRKNVPDSWIDFRSACTQKGHAIDRGTMPGVSKGELFHFLKVSSRLVVSVYLVTVPETTSKRNFSGS